MAQVSEEKKALRRIAANWMEAERLRREVVKREVAALRRIAAYTERPVAYMVACESCGSQHSVKRTKGNHRRVCRPCKGMNEMAAKRAAKAARRARLRGSARERIDPLEVFEAEGWICYLCGVLTDKTKRGTYDPLAPELEHVIPLSKGGTHTRDNVRCACRRCNGLKADAVPLAA